MNSPFDKVFVPDKPKELIVESRLSVLVRHLPADVPVLGEAYYEIERRTKAIIKEVFLEYGLEAPKDVSVKL